MDIKVGDVVILVSGSPDMTVLEIYTNSEVRTVWFDDTKHFQTGVFPVSGLRKKTIKGQ